MTARLENELHASGCRMLVGRNPIVIVNPEDQGWTGHRYVLGFGAYGWTRLLVYASSLDDALDHAIDWLVVHAPGHIVDDQIAEDYAAAIAEGLDIDAAMERAEVDTTCGGNAGNAIASAEWFIIAEDPTRAQLAALVAW